MEAKTYRVKSISEALERIREELGPEASVLHSRRINQGLWRWLSGDRYEVVASRDAEVPHRFEKWLDESLQTTEALVQQEMATDDHSQGETPDWEPYGTGAPSSGGATHSSFVSRCDESFEEFLGQGEAELWGEAGSMESVDGQVFLDSIPQTEQVESPSWHRMIADAPQHNHGWEQLFAWLKTCGAESFAADRICEDLKKLCALARNDSASHVECPEWDELVSLLAGQLKRGGTIQCRAGHCQRVALVGPTGVGKTTTIAKLAGEYKLRRGLNVGLITVDTYRVGAVDQIQAYARIMKTPLHVVSTVEEMRDAVQAMDHMDLVLIDTIGRSPGDVQRINQLGQVLRAADLDQIYLTLSATSSLASLERSQQAFQYLTSVAASSLVLTKVDEAQTLASLYPFLQNCPTLWSYWTNGQDVPDDLGVARENVATWFLDQIRSS